MGQIQKLKSKYFTNFIDMQCDICQITRFRQLDRAFLELQSVKSKVEKISPNNKTSIKDKKLNKDATKIQMTFISI